MWRRRGFKLLIASTLVSLAVVMLFIFFKSPNEPTYKGLTMVQWHTSGPSTPTQDEALISLGTNNLRLLIHRLKYDQNKDRMFALYRRLPGRLKKSKFLKDLCTQNFAKHDAAQYVMEQLLGRHAAPAVPELAQMAGEGSPMLAINALFILSHIGVPAIPGILAGLSNTNPVVRNDALLMLSGYKDYPLAWHAVTDALVDADPTIRTQATNIIRHSGRLPW